MPYKFKQQLDKINFDINDYLEIVKRVAKREGYDPNKLSLCDDNIHKLQYMTPEGLIKKFGRVGYGDFIIWLYKELKGDVKKGYADMKRNTFRKSHGAITEKYNLNKYSSNELAIRIIW